ncbi:MAG TPA: glycosyltransferase [Vicinamibacterales bacterium]|nr:glycosyltransferase [Vicinamibacterales bacterium]
MRLGIVVQRYGADINGGAELHARYIAERLARHHEVAVLTTCARDYVTWANELPPGEEQVRGVPVHRFPVAHPRNPRTFGLRSEHVFTQTHSLQDELSWLDSEGPASPALIRHLERRRSEYDYYIFFSYRYYHSYHGIRRVPDRAILVPTAERDPAVGLALFRPILRGVRAIMFNSLEEQRMLQHVAGTDRTPSVVVGVGSDVPDRPQPARFRQRFGIQAPFVVYIGRIDENKGCRELFDYFQRYARVVPSRLDLVLVGNSILPIPDHPRIHHLGFLSDEDKFDALAAAEALIMPSYFESLSMVALEAWALGKPVLANGRCDVLKGQSIRSNAGLYYESFPEFAEALQAIVSSYSLKRALGRNGMTYFRQHYAWSVIERKYLDMLERLSAEPHDSGIEPLPGFFARRRRVLPPAEDVLRTVPAGAVVGA